MPSRVIVYLRFPFARSGFEDPLNADWNSSKDQLLWNVLSKTTNREDINCVSVPFILQQAALLYEKELARVRTQMKRVQVRSSSRGSPRPPSLRQPTERQCSPSAASNGSVSSSSRNGDSSSRVNDSTHKGRRLLSQSRNFKLDHEFKYDAIVEDDDDGLFHYEPGRSKNSSNYASVDEPKESSSLTDFSQGSISKSNLADALNDLPDDLSSSASRNG